MIELEIQALAQQREGLVVEIGRLAGHCGYTLVRQRQVQDPHGVLLTMVVRGSRFRKRALRSALEACERLVSFELEPSTDGEPRPHFAATRKLAAHYAPPPAPPPEPAAPAEALPAEATEELPPPAPDPVPVESFEAFLPIPPRAPPPLAAEPAPAPFVDVPALAADAQAVEQALAALEHDYPRIVPRLLALGNAVVAGARESSLQLAGQRVGAWLFAREYALDTGLALDAALAAIAVPALHAYAEVELRGRQLHLHHGALCAEGGDSGCSFHVGFLEGLLGPALASHGLTVFPVCCRSCGAGECVLALAD